MDTSYVQKIKEWSKLTTQLNQLRDQISKLNEDRKTLEDDILEYVEDNNLQKVSLNITEGVIKFPKKTVQQSISAKYLKSTLQKYNDENTKIDVDDVVDFLLSNLESKQSTYIKMYPK